jgi:hypothetical protein
MWLLFYRTFRAVTFVKIISGGTYPLFTLVSACILLNTFCFCFVYFCLPIKKGAEVSGHPSSAIRNWMTIAVRFLLKVKVNRGRNPIVITQT